MQTMRLDDLILPALGIYQHDRESGPREVGLVLDGKVVSRGTYHETDDALRHSGYGYLGGLANWIREGRNVKLVLDQPSYRDIRFVNDRKDLCWSGPRLTIDQYKRWRAYLRYGEALDYASLGLAEDAIDALREWTPFKCAEHNPKIAAVIIQLDDLAWERAGTYKERAKKMVALVETLSSLKEIT